jgi:hypothetical protein
MHNFDPTTGLETGVEEWGVDNANVAAPSIGAEEAVIQAGTLALRMKFDDFTGVFVMHCHRLNHEDNGLMALVNVIPAVSTYAVAIPGSPGHAAKVDIYDGNGDRLVATVTPFPGFKGTVSVAMGDINDDGISDLVVGAGKDHAPEVVVYSGKGESGQNAFATELALFNAFAPEARGGISVASAQIDGSTADNIVVGSGPGIPSEVKVFSSELPSVPGTAPAQFASFTPYANDSSGVSVATGFVDFSTGRYRIVTAPGPGRPTQVKVFNYTLMSPIGAKALAKSNGKTPSFCPDPRGPALTAAFMPFGTNYRDGVSLATGWLNGSIGGAERIIVGQLTKPGAVKIYSSGSLLDGGPATYLQSAEHSPIVAFTEMASFTPFDGGAGVRVAATSTTTGGDLLVSGVSAQDKTAQVLKYQLVRPDAQAIMLQPKQIGKVVSAAGSLPNVLGGD